jgi:hypothetical protein
MKIPVAIIAACAGTFAFAQATTMTLAEDGMTISDTRRIELIQKLTPEGRKWLLDTVEIAHNDPNFNVKKVRDGFVNAGGLVVGVPPMADEDIEALVIIVMMSAAKGNADDLKSIMNAVKASEEEKQKMHGIENAPRILEGVFGPAYEAVAPTYGWGLGPNEPIRCGYFGGWVPRGAYPGDEVCVDPRIHDQTIADNIAAPSRTKLDGRCVQGYVWREANPNDHVCVTPEIRIQTRADNLRAYSQGQQPPTPGTLQLPSGVVGATPPLAPLEGTSRFLVNPNVGTEQGNLKGTTVPAQPQRKAAVMKAHPVVPLLTHPNKTKSTTRLKPG